MDFERNFQGSIGILIGIFNHHQRGTYRDLEGGLQAFTEMW